MTYHQPQVPVKFSSPNPQIESQGMLPVPIQMHMQIPIPLPVANAPPQVQLQMFVPGLQPHQLPSQGTLLQGQGLNFPQLPPQSGSLGMGIGQYTQQRGQFGGPRKNPVKITHQETHQEVRLDNPADSFSDRSPSGMSPQLDCCGIGIRADDKWAKVSGTFASGHDLHLDVGFGGNLCLRPRQGANCGVLRSLHA